MHTVAIACRTIEDEINAVVKELPGCCPVRWVESGLHNFPVKLKDRLQQEIKSADGAENILLLFGYCGNSIEGLRSHSAQLVVPKVADCISLLLNGDQKRLVRSYFLTEGWLRGEDNICCEFLYCVKKYGRDKALDLYRTMLKSYSTLAFIDTGTYNLNRLMTETAEFAASLNLTQQVVTGSLSLLRKALKGEWDDDFIKVPPGMALRINSYSGSVD